MKEEKDNWKSNVFDSIKNIKKAEPPAELYSKILTKIENGKKDQGKIIRIFPQTRLIAAAVLVLMVLNGLTIYKYLKSGNNSTPSTYKTENYLNISYDLNLYEE